MTNQEAIATVIQQGLEHFGLNSREEATSLPPEKKKEIYNFLVGRYMFYQPYVTQSFFFTYEQR